MKSGSMRRRGTEDVNAFYFLDYGWDCKQSRFCHKNALTRH